MRILNLHTAPIEDVAPKTEGHAKDSPALRVMERAGLIKVLDRAAPPELPAVTPEVVAKLTANLDAANDSIASLKASLTKANDENAVLAAKLKFVPADLAQAGEQIAKLEADLASANALLEEATKGKKGK
jgi:septal ring factor EnvC (AmiA/AmiB activator)